MPRWRPLAITREQRVNAVADAVERPRLAQRAAAPVSAGITHPRDNVVGVRRFFAGRAVHSSFDIVHQGAERIRADQVHLVHPHDPLIAAGTPNASTEQILISLDRALHAAVRKERRGRQGDLASFLVDRTQRHHFPVRCHHAVSCETFPHHSSPPFSALTSACRRSRRMPMRSMASSGVCPSHSGARSSTSHGNMSQYGSTS